MSPVDTPAVLTESLQKFASPGARKILGVMGAVCTVVLVIAVGVGGLLFGASTWFDRKVEERIALARTSEASRSHTAKVLSESFASEEFRSRAADVCREAFKADAAIARQEHSGYANTLVSHDKRLTSLEAAYQGQSTLLAGIKSTMEAMASDIRDIKASRRR